MTYLAIPDFLKQCSNAIEQELQDKALPYIVKNLFEISSKNGIENVATKPTICTAFNGDINISKELTGVRDTIVTIVDFSIILLVQSNVKDKVTGDHDYIKCVKKALAGKEVENFTNILYTDTTVDYIENLRMYMISFKCYCQEDLN